MSACKVEILCQLWLFVPTGAETPLWDVFNNDIYNYLFAYLISFCLAKNGIDSLRTKKKLLRSTERLIYQK